VLRNYPSAIRYNCSMSMHSALGIAKNKNHKPAKSLLDLSLQELREWIRLRGYPEYRAVQVWQAIYRQLEVDPEKMTSLPKALREVLSAEFPFPNITPVRTFVADGGDTEKVLFQLEDGNAIESVLMEYMDGRATVCVSSQAGCAIGCTFCATGLGGFYRNLSAGEIVYQILYFSKKLRDKGKRLTNIVYMGMGEPLANLDAVWRSVENLHEPTGMNFSARRITISTAGLVHQIDRFPPTDLQVNLAISLHAPNDDLRTSIMPINRRWPISELIASAKRYVERTHRRITFEYVLIAGCNSSKEHARDLSNLLRGLLCHVNLIPLNRVPGSPFEPPSTEEVNTFRDILLSAGIPCTVRLERGADILAACGQLRMEHSLHDAAIPRHI